MCCLPPDQQRSGKARWVQTTDLHGVYEGTGIAGWFEGQKKSNEKLKTDASRLSLLGKLGTVMSQFLPSWGLGSDMAEMAGRHTPSSV